MKIRLLNLNRDRGNIQSEHKKGKKRGNSIEATLWK